MPRYTVIYPSPVGALQLESDGESLVGLWILGQKHFVGAPPGESEDGRGVPAIGHATEWLDGYFAGERPSVAALPLAPAGGPFRQAVWSILIGIPYGKVMTYGAVAGEMAGRGGAGAAGRPGTSARAVGGAVGRNPISLIVPCHRVVGSDGSLTGYAGGIGVKAWLLEHEGADMTGLRVPRKGTAL
ncbi:MAG: methylated-DNA--[protein]-cysteine S-methyltransferase [Deltaproteobacteria bacterium]|nr:methylated-DNA--[protein]-cysteine S-methyltransferase [Deltaproteobacteria bacterium]